MYKDVSLFARFLSLCLQFIQPPGSAPTEVMEFSLPKYSIPWIRALAHYLRQNLLIFLHVPKYTDSNMEHHFKVTFTFGVPLLPRSISTHRLVLIHSGLTLSKCITGSYVVNSKYLKDRNVAWCNSFKSECIDEGLFFSNSSYVTS